MIKDFWKNSNVKVAVVDVYVCGECPYMEMNQITPYCRFPEHHWVKLDAKLIFEYDSIPDWCPLSNRDKGE